MPLAKTLLTFAFASLLSMATAAAQTEFEF